MALLHIEGFDEETTGDGLKTWLARRYNTSFSPSAGIVTGRFNGSGIELVGLSSWMAFLGTSPTNEFWVGVAIRAVGFPHTNRIIEFQQGGSIQGSVYIRSGGRLAVFRGTGTFLDASPPATIRSDTWHWLEIYFKLADAGGRWIVKVDGQQLIDFTGDTQASFDPVTIDNMVLRVSDPVARVQFDDFYMSDSGWLDPLTIRRLLPNGDETAEFTIVGSEATHHESVDETAVDDDTSAVDGTTGQRDVFTYAPIGLTPTSVQAVDIITDCRLTDASIFSVKHVVKSGTTDDEDAGQALADTNYTVKSRLLETDPDTSAAWTGAGVDAAAFGVEAE